MARHRRDRRGLRARLRVLAERVSTAVMVTGLPAAVAAVGL